MAAFFVGEISVPARSKQQARINANWGTLRPKEKPLNEGLFTNPVPETNRPASISCRWLQRNRDW